MPPVQTSIDSQSLLVNNYDVVILTCAILSLLFILMFIFMASLAWQSISRRRGIYGNVFHPSTPSPDIRSPRARNVRKETLFLPTVSALVIQSTVVASYPLQLGIVPNNLWPSSAAGYPKGILSHGLEPEPSSRGRAKGPAASPPNGDGSRINNTTWLLPTSLRGLRKWLFIGLFAGLRQQVPSASASARKSAGSQRHAPDVVEATEATSELGLGVLEPDTIGVPGIFLSTVDAQVETGTLPIPLIILSPPSSENLVEDTSPPVSLDEGFLSPDGTFRSSGRPTQAPVRTCDISDATRLALASRLRHRKKRAIPLPSPDVSSSPGMVRWPRWL
ncbi:hypothetical protein EI94DRAFT_1741554 [Lactarius quietus]|nr:hypothetical protein EI94DRAFT_1741554 [Lactarius quietus]